MAEFIRTTHEKARTFAVYARQNSNLAMLDVNSSSSVSSSASKSNGTSLNAAAEAVANTVKSFRSPQQFHRNSIPVQPDDAATDNSKSDAHHLSWDVK